MIRLQKLAAVSGESFIKASYKENISLYVHYRDANDDTSRKIRIASNILPVEYLCLESLSFVRSFWIKIKTKEKENRNIWQSTSEITHVRVYIYIYIYIYIYDVTMLREYAAARIIRDSPSFRFFDSPTHLHAPAFFWVSRQNEGGYWLLLPRLMLWMRPARSPSGVCSLPALHSGYAFYGMYIRGHD